jgi:hypothetical protein
MEKYGFIYLWYDRKRKMYYVGSHWGTIDDGYICSSNWMRNAYARRSQDFKRSILTKNFFNNRNDLLIEEQRWLDMIKQTELGVRYYNRTSIVSGISPNGRKNAISDKTKQKMSQAKLGKPSNSPTKFTKGQTPWNKDTKGAQIAWNKGIPAEQSHLYGKPKSEETKRRISEAQKGKPRPPGSGMIGKKHSEETKQKIRMAKLNKQKELHTVIS